MKLKSYLRGLGLGMIVTTIILVLAFRARNKEMTDAEIIARAQQLGMVETSLYGSGEKEEEKETGPEENKKTEESGEGKIDPESLSSGETQEESRSGNDETDRNETSGETTPAVSTEATTVAETTKAPETTPAPETTKAPETTPEETQKPQETTKAEIITILFEDISSADKASRLLYEAGIIQNVESFNDYLSEHGLATKVGEGEFQFRKGMSFEEIAAIITRRALN